MKTDFMIVGAQKAATSTLFEMLRRTGGISGSTPKEPQFFSTCADWRAELPRYHAMFEQQDGVAYCEASTTYTFFPHRNLEIWNDIHAYNRNVRIIYIVRNPLDRIVSHYKHSYRRGYTKASLPRFVLDYPIPLSICRYHAQIAPFVERFGRDQVLLLDYDEVVGRSPETLARLARFTGIDREIFDRIGPVHDNAGETIAHHRFVTAARALARIDPRLASALLRRLNPAIDGAPDFPEALKRAVIHLLDDDIARLETLMERDFTSWRAIRDSGAPVAAR